jgi:phosphoglycerate-specific signal transduction histidine kinase
VGFARQLEIELNTAIANEAFAENKAYMLEKELKQARERIKRLEEAGNQMELVLISFQIFSDFRKSDSIRASLNWNKAKEAKP